MEKIRVLIVDDSLVIRGALRECFRADPEIEVVGVAENGVRAIEQFALLKPDLVTLDVEMPEMDGLETLRVLREQGASVPIIMFSKYTQEGASASMKALELGASDVVAKPSANKGVGHTYDVVKRQLSVRIRALGRQARRARRDLLRPHVSESSPAVPVEFSVPTRVDAVGIAISTGGPSALIEIAKALDPAISVPIFITQHMPPIFTKHLAERLSARGALVAHEAADGMVVHGGEIYVAPGNYHLDIARNGDEAVILLSQSPPENSCRPSADFMFRALASAYEGRVLGIVMTGMGHDGRKGSEAIKSAGGVIVAQDEASSLVWGMPKSVISAELHDAIVPLSSIAPLINRSCIPPKEKT